MTERRAAPAALAARQLLVDVGLEDRRVSPGVRLPVEEATRCPEKVEGALRSALRANRQGLPVLIDVHIAKHDYPKHFVDFHREVWGLGTQSKAGKSKRRAKSG